MKLFLHWRQRCTILPSVQRLRQALWDGVNRYIGRHCLRMSSPGRLPGTRRTFHRLCPQLVQDILMLQLRTFPLTINNIIRLICNQPFQTVPQVMLPRQVESMIPALPLRQPTGTSIIIYCISSYSDLDIVMCLRDMASVPTMKGCISGVLINVLSTRTCVVVMGVTWEAVRNVP